MKKLFISLVVLLPLITYAQKDTFDESIEAIDFLDDQLSDYYSSFLENPQIHSNTLKVLSKITDIYNFCKEQQTTKNSISYELLSYPKVQEYYKKLNDLQLFTDIFYELLRPFNGYFSSGINQNQMSILEEFFRASNWKITHLDIKCEDVDFYEYERNGCKLMFIKNNLPEDEYRYIYNYVKVNYSFNSYDQCRLFVIIKGNRYRMIQFRDDQNTNYRKILKAISNRHEGNM